MKNLRFLIFSLFLIFPTKSFSLIEVDITRGNLNPLPIAVSSLFSSEQTQSDLDKKLMISDLGLEISKVVENNLTGVHNDWETHGDPGVDAYKFYDFWKAEGEISAETPVLGSEGA